MASVESNKKVARAAKAGGGLSRRQTSTSWGYYGTLIGIAVVGTGLIASSYLNTREDGGVPYFATPTRTQKETDLLRAAQKKYKDKPKAKELVAAQARFDKYNEGQHIHAAYGIFDCTKPKGKEWLAPVNGEEDLDPFGIHAHADGLIHTHPFSRAVAGRRAQLSKFFSATGLDVTDTKIVLPAKTASTDNPSVVATKATVLKAGTKCLNGKVSEVAVYEFETVLNKEGLIKKTAEGKRTLGKPSSILIKKDYAYVFALIEKGKVPDLPPSASALVAPSDVVSADPTGQLPVSVETVTATTIVGAKTSGATTVVAPTTAKAATPTTVKK